ncbi:MAG TPA: hypothetical protein VFX70_19000 [Mycobacteriales bacterium]|nr:hypothetical protein [Mycobacteriales bacterium]
MAIPATTVASAFAAVLVSVWSGWGSPPSWDLPIFGLALLISELSVVRFVIGRQGISFSLNDAIIVVAFVLAPGAWIVLWVLVGHFVTNVRRSPSVKLRFNMATLAVAIAAGAAVTTALHGGITAALAGIVVFAVVNQMLTAVAVWATSGQKYLRVLGAAAGLGAIHSAGNASLGLLAAWLVLHAPLGLVALVAPLVLLRWSYDQQGKRATEARLFEELADGQEQIMGKSVDTSAQVVVTAAARSFGGAEVEMLLRHPDGPIRYVGDEHGIQSRIRIETDAFGSPPVLRAMAARGVLTGVEQERPFCSALLGDYERPLAVIIARRPERAGPFTREDQRLTEVLVRQAEAWLSVADLTARHDAVVGQVEVYGAANRMLGDIGAGTAPALTVLRESANRLSRLAYAFDGPDPISEIVGELHSVERAVASLLGAIALTSDPPTDGGGDGVDTAQSSNARTEVEWTTTGRLEVTESW